MLKFVVELSQEGQTPDLIFEALRGRFPINSKLQQAQQHQVLQQPPTVAEASQMLSNLVAKEIAPYLAAVLDELRELRQEVSDLRGQLAQQQEQQAITARLPEPQQEQQEQQPPAPAQVEASEPTPPFTPAVDQVSQPEPEPPPRHWWEFWRR